VARLTGAAAFTFGSKIVFARSAGSDERVLKHELAHVAQQSRGLRSGRAAQAESQAEEFAHCSVPLVPSAAPSSLQMKIEPEDVAVEMIGRSFELSADFKVGKITLKKGTLVYAQSWVNASATIFATAAGVKAFTIQKTLLRPHRTAVKGISPYSAKAAGSAKDVQKHERDLAAWQATANKALYKSPVQKMKYGEEESRISGLLDTSRGELNRNLIRETMYNRFDSIIKSEVDAANTAHGLKDKKALDPNLVKSLLFHESGLGTFGEHLEDPPTQMTKTRFNLGQVIDSGALALLTMMEKEQPALLAKYGLTNLRKSMQAAQNELAKLEKNTKRTDIEDNRLADLQAHKRGMWENFLYHFIAPGQTKSFGQVVRDDLFKPTAKNFNYQFWIHMAVLWLFEKKKKGMSWEATVQAFNGTGNAGYRKAIVQRAKGAAAAEKAKKEFVPKR